MTTYPTTQRIRTLLSTAKRKFIVTVLDGADKSFDTSSYWSDGSREYYFTMDTAGHTKHECPSGVYPSFNTQFTLPAGKFLIQSGIFNGKPGTPFVYVYKEDLDSFNKLFDMAIV